MKEQYGRIRGEVARAIQEVLDSQVFILGPVVDAFEKEMADLCGVPHAIGVASGTDALLLSLMALGVHAGDRVVTASYTFFSTGGSISRLGAVPVYIDIDPRTYNIDPNRLEDYLKKIRQPEGRPSVLVPVHLFGQMADMAALMDIARKYEMHVVEDAAQALGARQIIGVRGQGQKGSEEWMAGTVGDLGCFSFYPSKNLGGAGDAGMLITRDDKLAERVRILRDHGAHPKYYHRFIGLNSRLDALQAAVLRVKLKYLKQWTEKRRGNAACYRALFGQRGFNLPPITLPYTDEGYYHIFNQFIIRAERRDELREYLNGEGIGSEIYYPVPLHLQECYRGLGYSPGDLLQSEQAARETLALPIYPELSMEQQERVVETIEKFYRGKTLKG